MRTLSLAALGVTLALTSLTSTSLLANDQPDAKSLVGKTYAGAHGIYLKSDNDRMATDAVNSEYEHGSGVGLELGYRMSEHYEARLSYSYFNLDTKHKGYDVGSGTNAALDLLYFPYQESFYVVAGANALDVDHSDFSAGLGAGYRHYISNNAAIYLEGQGLYQFDNSYTDFISKIGFVYYFGETSSPAAKPAKIAKPAPAQPKMPIDSDKDGVPDAVDRCMNTPMTDKVDDVGCTIFMEQEKVMDLSVLFDNNKYNIKHSALAEIARAADFLKQYPHVSIIIHGHTSSVGDAAYNQSLSEKRAQAIVDTLVSDFGISASRLNAKGHGESQLINTANTAKAHAENRRIEARIVGKTKTAIKR